MQERSAHTRGESLSVADRRRHGRITQQQLRSSIGPVVDLSAGGMRVVSDRRLKGELTIVLHHEVGLELAVQARVMWRKRIGFRQHMIGLEFFNLTPNDCRQLARIGMISRSGLSDIK
ncbi:MAG: PilZ domain-containing protein [Phycisphaeraceae bacterium]